MLSKYVSKGNTAMRFTEPGEVEPRGTYTYQIFEFNDHFRLNWNGDLDHRGVTLGGVTVRTYSTKMKKKS